ncbi:MAG: ABC transporter ATP-binding protein [Pseudomonadota bacterium]
MLITARDVRKRYSSSDGDVTVLNGVSLDLDHGETLALTGESGSGKSTLLHLLAALDAPDAGEITLQDTKLSDLSDTGRAEQRRQTVGLVFQQFNLIPALDVYANLTFQARLADKLQSEWVTELTDRLGLTDLLHRYPEQLSGGQQQRVAIGRAMASKPPVLMADEPTGNLDEATAETVINLLLELIEETGAGLLMVTHSTKLASRLSRRVHLSNGKLA